jgi:hypothetical protein
LSGFDKPHLGHLGKSDVNEIRDALEEFGFAITS